MHSTPPRLSLFASVCAGIFVFGIVFALLGVLFGLPEMRARLGINLAQQGDLFLLLYLGIFLATLAAGPSMDHFGHRPVLLLSAVLTSAAMLLFNAADNFALAGTAAIVLGFGGGGLNTATNAFVSEACGEARGPMLNYLGIFFGFGALFLPLLAASLSHWFTISQMLVAAASLSAICAVTYAALKFPPPRGAGSSTIAALGRAARDPLALLFALVLFCQSGNEAVVGGWTSTFLGSRGANARTAMWILAGFWASMMVGRLFAGRLLRRYGKPQIVLAGALGTILGCAILLASSNHAAMTGGVLLVGLSFSGIFPTVLAMAGDRFAESAGTVFGFLFAVALVGGMTFPWAAGHLAQAYGVAIAMVLPLAGAAFICVLILVAAREDNGAKGPFGSS
jgi:fucose permease